MKTPMADSQGKIRGRKERKLPHLQLARAAIAGMPGKAALIPLRCKAVEELKLPSYQSFWLFSREYIYTHRLVKMERFHGREQVFKLCGWR
jgi:hypothetical protein